jgi:hypothetical protein
MSTASRALMGGLVLVLAAATFAVQRPAPAQPPADPGRPAGTAGEDEPRLIFEREIFTYPNGSRRDPFRPLTGRDEMGPLFDDLTLRMIIHSDVPGESIAVVADRSGRTHRLRRGQSIGNATVAEITPTQVVFTVADLGVRRREVLYMRRNQQEGA